MSDRELRDELMTLLVAGHETTATGLSWAIELLARHPAELARLEADVAGGDGTYLDAVIKETLRLRPVIALVLRMVEPMEFGGRLLPAGVSGLRPSTSSTGGRRLSGPGPIPAREVPRGNLPGPTAGSRSAVGCGAAWVGPSPSSRCRSSYVSWSPGGACGPPPTRPSTRWRGARSPMCRAGGRR